VVNQCACRTKSSSASLTRVSPRRRVYSGSRHLRRAERSRTCCPPPDPRVMGSIREARSTSFFRCCLRHRASTRQRSSGLAMSAFSRSRRVGIRHRGELFGGLLVLRPRRDAVDARRADRRERLRPARRRGHLLRRVPAHAARCPAYTRCERLRDLSGPPSRLWVCHDSHSKEGADVFSP
jgi:hypothetical protein